MELTKKGFKNLPKKEKDRIIKYWKEKAKDEGKTIEIKDDEIILGKEKTASDEEENLTKMISSYVSKINLAEQFIEINPLYFDKAKMWWLWISEDKCWKLSDEVEILNLIERVSLANTINARERTEILNALKQVARRNRPKDPEISWIQFKDAILDIETGGAVKPSPEWFLTNPIPWKLGKGTKTPTIDRIFKEWVGKDHVQTLYEMMAYCLLRDYPMARLFWLLGAGSNGKTSFFRLIEIFLGVKNCGATDLEILLSSRFENKQLHNKLVCLMGEANFDRINKTSIIKRLTGRDRVRLEYKGKDVFDFYNYAKILIATNNLPATTDKTTGWYRRNLIIDFPNKFSEKKDILKDIPKEEFENLTLKCISILLDLLEKREFHNEGTDEQKAMRYEEKSNPLKKFWEDNVDEDMDSIIFKFEFRDTLKKWCRANRFRELSDKEIKDFLYEKAIYETQKFAEFWTKEEKKPRIWAWSGLKWKQKRKHSVAK